MKALLAVVLLTMALPAFAFQEPDSFRGIPWGASPLEAKNAIIEGWGKREVKSDQYGTLYRIKPKGRNALDGQGRLKSFYFVDKIGDANVAFHIWFLDEKFVHAEMKFRSAFFPIIEAALAERYGPPTLEENNETQNRAGAKFTNRELTWAGKNISLRATKYFTTITDSHASIGQRAYLEYVLEQEKEKAKSAAKDF